VHGQHWQEKAHLNKFAIQVQAKAFQQRWTTLRISSIMEVNGLILPAIFACSQKNPKQKNQNKKNQNKKIPKTEKDLKRQPT